MAVNRSSEKNNALSQQFSVLTSQDPQFASNWAQVVVLAVKPQGMAELLSSMNDVDWKNKLVISVAAGITVNRLCEMANYPLRAIRVMPNTASLIGEGMTGLYAPQSVSNEEKQFASQLFNAVGKICWVNDEEKMNTVIAAAGSAPAYFFLFMEAMQAEAEKQGLSAELSRMLVQQAARGAAKLAANHSDLSIKDLRDQVTSKGGTTAEAIKVFEQEHLPSTIAKAMQAAVKRAKEMESLF